MSEVQSVTDNTWLSQIADCQVAMAFETEEMTLDRERVIRGIERMIQNPGLGNYFIILVNGTLAGTLMITKEWSDWRSQFFVWIQSVYIKPAFRKKGLYSKLYKHVRGMVENSDQYAGIRLYVEKNNTGAQQVYEKLGMNNDHYLCYEWEHSH